LKNAESIVGLPHSWKPLADKDPSDFPPLLTLGAMEDRFEAIETEEKGNVLKDVSAQGTDLPEIEQHPVAIELYLPTRKRIPFERGAVRGERLTQSRVGDAQASPQSAPGDQSIRRRREVPDGQLGRGQGTEEASGGVFALEEKASAFEGPGVLPGSSPMDKEARRRCQKVPLCQD
jgi:hypothetical protein